MSKSAKKIMVRVIINKMNDGESFDDIIKEYPKLTKEEIAELKEAVGA